MVAGLAVLQNAPPPHLFNWSSSLVSTLPFLSLIGLSVACTFLLIFLLFHTVVSCFLGLVHPLLPWLGLQ